MIIPHAGELAAAGTVLCWTASALFFGAASRRIGSLSVNLVRMVMAFALFAVTLTITRGFPVPVDFPVRAWCWLALSGLIGFTLGDMCLFQAFVKVGPRISMLVMSLVPAMTALLGWAVLGESYSVGQGAGIVLTIFGVAWVVLERQPPNARKAGTASPPITVAGLALALGGTVGQAVGLVVGKLGMGNLDAFAATQIRVVTGTLGFVALFAVLGGWRRVWQSLGNRYAMSLTAGGALAGPFLGVALLMLAIQYTSTGVASTIVALVPLTLIPPAMLIHRERVSLRALCGTFLAIGGVILLVATRA
jgi:drug/metabolite transporter (DMT)-like permease